MKNVLLTAIAFIGFICPNFAQFTSVTYDVNKNWFNEGQPLPAEKAMIFKGVLTEDVERVEINILTSKSKKLLYYTAGKRQSNNEFTIPVSYKLRASDKYDFRIDFFQVLSDDKQNLLKDQISATLDTYIAVNLSGVKSIKLMQKSSKTVKEMNSIVEEALSRYRSKIADWFPQFSEVVRLKLEQLEKADLDQGYVKGDTATTLQAVRQTNRQQLIAELQAQVEREVDQLLDIEMLVLSESQIVDDYETEAKDNGLAINIGYGGVYLSGNLDAFTYGSSPYAGLAFPLGNNVLGSKFLRNSSVTIGFFFDNFEDDKGNEVTGFLVGRPTYLGLDYKLFKFIRINAGATFLEGIKPADPNNPESVPGKNIMIRPFIGLSARIDLSIGLGK